jgi:MFS family permease
MSSLPTQPRGDTDFGWRFLTPLLLGSALNPINSSVIATALIPIGKAFGVSPAQTGLLVSTLYLASAVAQPTLGRLADRFGGKRVFLSGIILVLAGGLVGSFGGDISTLVVSRVLIGIGTSAAYPTAMVLISARASRAGIDPPGKVLGALAIAGQVTSAVGLPLGGVPRANLASGCADWPRRSTCPA